MRQRTGNGFHGFGDGLKGCLLNALNIGLPVSLQADSNRHFNGAAARDEFGTRNHVANDLHGVLKVAFNFVEHVLVNHRARQSYRLPGHDIP